MDAQEINLLSICKGSIPEFFEHAAQKIWDNIADPNTSVKKVRTLTLKFKFTPYPDRSGMLIELDECRTSLGQLDTSGFSCAAFLAKQDGKYKAFTRDLRQELLFDETTAEVK